MSEDERERARDACIRAARDNWERVYERRNFHQAPGSSHDGRLIAYLGEQALCLAGEAPREEVRKWLDFSIRTFMSIYPHWGGQDGGWAEGICYRLVVRELWGITGRFAWKGDTLRAGNRWRANRKRPRPNSRDRCRDGQ